MADSDTSKDLLDRILAAHESYYDIRRDYLYEGRRFPAFAEFHTYGEQYVLTKRAKLWEVNTHDFMFFELVDELDEAILDDLVDFIAIKGLRKVNAATNHMSSALTLVVIAKQCSDEAFKRVKSIRFRKNYLFGLHGWSDLRLAVVDLSRTTSEAIAVNAAGKKLKEALASNLALIQ